VSVSDPGTAAPTRSSSAKALAVFTVAVAFFVGTLVGALALWGWVVHHERGRLPFLAQLREKRIIEHLDRELKLTPQQHEAVARIVHERGRRIDAILSDVQPEVRREIDEGNVEVQRLLTAEQKVKFERMQMRLHSRRHMPAASSPAGSPAR
jgi:hypothetical protein